MVMENGTTQTTEKVVNPGSEYLKELPNHIRTYEQALAYLPNQTYIGNMTPDELSTVEQPWVGKPMTDAKRFGKFGEIMPQEEFLLLMQACDVFDLLKLEKSFVEAHKPAFAAHPLMSDDIVAKIKDGVELDEIEHFVNDEHAEPLYHMGKLVGYVKKSAEACGIKHQYIHSGAGHDAQFAAYMLPTTMIFVQSKDGLSHCEPEFSSVEHCTSGATVMLNAVLYADGEE